MATMFQDTMDNERVVKPIKSEGKSVLCKVYWRSKTGPLNYGGETKLPASLFDETPANRRIGFVPLSRDL